MTDDQPTPYSWVTSVQYNAAGLPTVTNRKASLGNETRQYNTRFQLTRLTAGAAMDTDYNYSATQNNGRVTSTLRHLVSNQTTTYGYDSLNRLTSASATASTLGAAWSETYTYDGFGNLTDKNVTGGSAPALHVTVDPATNRFTGSSYTYDANGNLKTLGTMTMNYDVANRVTEAGTEDYNYGADNLRMYKYRTGANEELHFYGAYGERLGVYLVRPIPGFSGPVPFYYVSMASTALYFRWAVAVGTRPAGIGRNLLSIRGRVHADGSGRRQVRNLLRRRGDKPAVREEPVLLERHGKVSDAGSVPRKWRTGRSGELEPLCLCGRRSGQL